MKDLKRTVSKTAQSKRENKKIEAFITLVLKEYTLYGRHDLPWRKSITPYKILVSEIMLQQTQVSRVTEKFTMWVSVYPTLRALSFASLKDILILWQGLGYQRRAKALYTISQTATRVPLTFDELILLPGVGKYTASAICAFAYNTFTEPVIETNIRTAIIEYFFSEQESIDDKDIAGILQKLHMNHRVVQVGARIWYYALIDYGANLKAKGVSHNTKSKHNHKQSAFTGSLRQVRAKVLFAITHDNEIPEDERADIVILQLIQEGFIIKSTITKSGYQIM